jgi:hypothetical protein
VHLASVQSLPHALLARHVQQTRKLATVEHRQYLPTESRGHSPSVGTSSRSPDRVCRMALRQQSKTPLAIRCPGRLVF